MQQARKNLDIEVLRAVAVLMILVDHIKFLAPWAGAGDLVHTITSLWGGVDVFFAISGFVITSMFLRQPPSARFVAFAVPFWIRRIYRIWPSALLWLAIMVLSALFFNRSGAFGSIVGAVYDAATVVMQVSNFHFHYCSSAAGGMGICGVNTIYWSLSVEEQFYLAFPFLFFFVPRRHLPKILLLFALIPLFLTRPPHSLLWWMRTDALAWGCLIALATTTRTHQALEPLLLASRWRAVGLTVFIILLVSAFGTNSVIPFQTGVIAVLSAILVWVASYNKGYTCPPGPVRTLLVWIGARSFALYLVHPFADFATRETMTRLFPGQVFDDSWLPLFIVVGLSLTFALAALNYWLFENPLRRRGVRQAARVGERIVQTLSTKAPPTDERELDHQLIHRRSPKGEPSGGAHAPTTTESVQAQ
jgi:peptidoglycan/LPS O-acetylase OafA/YrhL